MFLRWRFQEVFFLYKWFNKDVFIYLGFPVFLISREELTRPEGALGARRVEVGGRGRVGWGIIEGAGRTK